MAYHLTTHPLSSDKRIKEFLNQKKFWINAAMERVRVKDMDSQYLLATMMWLIERAPKVKFQYEMYLRSTGASPEDIAHVADETGEYWIKATVLFQSMQTRYLKLLAEPVESVRHIPFGASKKHWADDLESDTDASYYG
jgi:predicted metal-dependent hydrolase